MKTSDRLATILFLLAASAAHLALTLAAACCVDMALARRFAGLAACLGAALLLLAYLEAAGDFEG